MDARYHTLVSKQLDKEHRTLAQFKVLAAVAQAQRIFTRPSDIDAGGAILRLSASLDEHNGLGGFIRAWEKREKEVLHETAAFVDTTRVYLNEDFRPFVYWGMTSSDLQDTTDAVIYRDIYQDYLRPKVGQLAGLLETEAEVNDKRRGRTHGRLAEPVHVRSLYWRAIRDLGLAEFSLETSQLPGKLSGPVGAYNDAITVDVEQKAGSILAIEMDTYATQTVDRFLYARCAMAHVQLAGVCEQLATLHRLGSISGVELYAEGFRRDEQKGSSIMPYKRNPIASERICGLARVVRSSLSAVLETSYTQWWERDLTNSSVERTAFWDLIQLTYFLLTETIGVLTEGEWLPDPFYDPDTWQSQVDELIERQGRGENPEQVYREIQARG